MNPKYLQIKEQIFEEYWRRRGEEIGFQLPGERELQQLYRVGRPTISKAIAALAAEGWVRKRQGSGIYIAALEGERPLSTEPPRIGYITPTLQSVHALRILEGAEAITRSRGFLMEIAFTNTSYDEEREQILAMQQRGVQAIILYPTPYRPGEADALATQWRDFPIIVVDLYQPGMRRPHVIFDNRHAGREITRHFIREGHREIAFLRFEPTLTFRSVDDRFEGYQRALAEANLPLRPEQVRTLPETPDSIDALQREVTALLALSPSPTAIIAPSDQHAYHLAELLTGKGIAIPDEIAIAGFDHQSDITWGERFPTTHPNFTDMGERAAEMAIEQLQAPRGEIASLLLPCPLWLPPC